jgi:hypothetical protein
MPREVTDEEYNYLMGRKQVADFVESIYNDPSLNKEAKALIKRKYPNLQITDYDLETKIEKRFEAEKKARDDQEQAAKKAAEDDAWKKTREKTQQDYGFTEDGMKELEDFMVQKNIGDYEVAASYMASKNPKQSDATYGHNDGLWNHSKQEGFKEIASDPEGWARSQILQAIRRDDERNKGQR